MPANDETTAGPVSAHDQREGSAAAPDPAWVSALIYTIGHSTRPQEELIELLQGWDVATLADVRTIPRSRHNPQFNLDELAAALPRAGIAYIHLASLGGLRHGIGAASPNQGWHNKSFRGYADYMQTPEFANGLEELRELTTAGPVGVMCAEAVPWRCHRSLIADALLVRGVIANEIQSITRTAPHQLAPFAHVKGLKITYPASESPDEKEAS